jgi:type III secretion protein W
MATRIDHHTSSEAAFGAEVKLSEDRAGSLAGEQVRPKDAISILEDAREEISMHHAEKVEAKESGEIEVSGETLADYIRVQQVETYLEASHKFQDPRELAEIIRRLQASRRPREMVKGETSSRPHQFALLRLAHADAEERDLGVDVIERLDEAMQDLGYESGPEILAGFNTVGAASEFDPSAEGVENFRQAYSDIVLGERTLAEMLQVVLKRLAGAEGDDLERGLKALLSALGADLAAARSSIDPLRLRALVQDIYQLEVAGSVLEDCRSLSASMARRFGIDSVVPMALMQELVAITNEKWLAPARLHAMAKRFAAAALAARIAFYSGTRRSMTRMPVHMFSDPDARESILKTFRLVVDEAVQEEEEQQGS